MRSALLPILLVVVLSCEKLSSTVEVELEIQESELTIFGKDLISTDLYERDMAISPDGKLIIYSLGDYKQTRRSLVQLRKVNDQWEGPMVLSISGLYQDIEPFLTKDGKRLFFASNRPMNGTAENPNYNIWYSDWGDSDWHEPIALDTAINTTGDEFYPSVSANGNLYFTATRKDGIGREDIFVAEFQDGEYAYPVVLDTSINTAVYEFNAFINPAEDLLIFSAFGRKDGFGGGDLYYSKKDNSGTWLPAKNLGPSINSNKLDYCPFIDYPRNNFYFTSDRSVIDSSVHTSTDQIRNYANSVENGMGNIYRIQLPSLDL